ncbi:hypothetical protein ACQ5SI_18575 [Peribacillus frigoritolerans]
MFRDFKEQNVKLEKQLIELDKPNKNSLENFIDSLGKREKGKKSMLY